jgi:chromosome segregation ATPase
MNVFQEVFASVNPRSRGIIREIENESANLKNETKRESSKPRVSLAPEHRRCPNPPVNEEDSEKGNKSDPKKRKFSLPVRHRRLRNDADDDRLDVGASRSKYEALQSQIDTVAEQIQIVESSLRLAHSQNAELFRRNSELESYVGTLRQSAADTNRRMVEFKARSGRNIALLDDTWEAQLSELMTELTSLQEPEVSSHV